METLFERITKLMDSQQLYTNPTLSRKQLAIVLNTNQTYLYQAIRQETGLSFTAYIYDLRLSLAYSKLTDPDEQGTIEAISKAVGYKSRKTFHHHFRQVYGCTPDEVRRKNKEY